MRIILLIAMVASLLSCSKPDHQQLYEEVKSADKMVFASMAVTKTAKTDRTDWYKIGKRIAVFSYDSYLRAYIDMSALRPEDIVFDEKSKTVRLTLPPVQTEVVGRDMELREVYENIGMFRTEIDSKERAGIKELANRSFRKEIEENPIFKQQLTETAMRKARRYFEKLFEDAGYRAEIEIEN